MKRLLVLFLVFIFFASPVFALLSGLKPETKNNLVKISSDIIVPHGTTVKSAFALNGNVNVSGIVQEDVVSFGGNIFLDKNSKVMGDVVSVGGTIKKEKGAEIMGQISEVNLGPFAGLPSFLTYKNLLWISALFQLTMFIAMLALVFLVIALFQKQVGRASYYAEKSPWKAFFWGLAILFTVIPIALFLIVSLVGIVLLPLYMLILAAASIFGFIVISQLVGKKIFQALRLKNKPMLLEAAFGFLIFALTALIPVIGIIVKFTAVLIGLGAVATTKFGTKEL
ncbi:hypothetical protein A2310_02030 [candidate division WOR-1 bacterium RIFOXYB2_FULL_37_13]|uniref:DUF8173 domain-containing protein n=1 Tax=candidate division WOR-1 bacterium RIFOXYB2_FULL_37_13 TaxID=1802579 RepID=A0A1F4SDR5_UNCSA|nr:MAG: hypothetical protein A2310_02030 [candidate division WOR-1 bacterium RIFOXYB2_FULL_37_13]